MRMTGFLWPHMAKRAQDCNTKCKISVTTYFPSWQDCRRFCTKIMFFKQDFSKLSKFQIIWIIVLHPCRASLGQNHTFVSRTVLVTLNVGHAPTFGFSLKFFSSGSAGAVAITGYIGLTTARGNLSYPLGGGNYQNSESALITITPTVPGKPTLRFTFVDMEGASCLYDYVRTFTWFENTYSQVARLDGIW